MDKTLSRDANQADRQGMGNSERDRLAQLGRALSHTQRLAGIGSLSAGTAHELTSPLSVITATCSNLLYELQDESVDQELLKYYVRLIERNAFRIAQIVRVLQDYARIDEPQIVVTDVDMILRDSLAMVEKQFLKQSQIRIAVDTAGDLSSVVCDHNRITQVLLNLLANARDAMEPEGGTIQLRFWSTQKSTVDPAANETRNKDGSGQFAFSVCDSGHGIPADIKDEIFRPFFSTRLNGQCVGLGLFVAKGIVEQHNGRIWAENNPLPQNGATVTVMIPLRSSLLDGLFLANHL